MPFRDVGKHVTIADHIVQMCGASPIFLGVVLSGELENHLVGDLDGSGLVSIAWLEVF